MTDAVTLRGVSLDYPVYSVGSRSFKSALFAQVVGSSIVTSGKSVGVRAIDDVSLTFEDGDRIGLVGHNGCGKSSLLRVLAGVTPPASGSVEVRGRVISLLGQGLGVNPELSGRRNIELPLRLLGATQAEIDHAKEEIPEWTGLGSFIDLPLRTYSQGMVTRLMFAISTALAGDVLLLDEWIGAGDAEFAHRAQERLHAMLSSTGTVVLASHATELVRQFCDKCVWMADGKVRAFGPTEEVIVQYYTFMAQNAEQEAEAASAPIAEGPAEPAPFRRTG